MEPTGVDGRDLNELLVSAGLARIYGTRTPLPDGRDSRTWWLSSRRDFQATVAQQQKQIEALTAGLQKVSAQLELSESAPQVANNP